MVKVLRERPFHFVRQMMVEGHHPHCHPFLFIDRHSGIIRRLQILAVTDKLVDPACGLIPVQMNTCIRVPVCAAFQNNASAIVIFVGIVCPAECMAAATDSVMVFQEVCPLFLVLMIQEERIDCQPTVRIIAASCEKAFISSSVMNFYTRSSESPLLLHNSDKALQTAGTEPQPYPAYKSASASGLYLRHRLLPARTIAR